MPDITVQGYVIVGPLNPWDEPHRDEIIGYMSYGTFGWTAGEAWLRKTGGSGLLPGDHAMRVQRLMDRGYRLARATMTISAVEEEACGHG